MARLPGALSWIEFTDETMVATRMVEAEPQAWGDVIVARRDIPTSYHLAVVVDDALQGVSHVVRGQDLYSATGVQRLLQELLGLVGTRIVPAGAKLVKKTVSAEDLENSAVLDNKGVNRGKRGD